MNMHRLRRSGKKCLALLGILALCLTGCGKGETAEEASYEKSIAAYRASERANILIKQNVSMEDGSTVMTSQLLGLLEIKNPGGENTEAGMTNSTITMNLGGDDMQISFSNYYKDSMLYTRRRLDRRQLRFPVWRRRIFSAWTRRTARIARSMTLRLLGKM